MCVDDPGRGRRTKNSGERAKCLVQRLSCVMSGVRDDLHSARLRSCDRSMAGGCEARKTAVYAGIMAQRGCFWMLEHLSDAQPLESLGGVLRRQHRALAEVIAHLGEVEERRLHLEAACGSMFTYCVARLGMSEDEACRRIELARLARKFPPLFAELDSGRSPFRWRCCS